MSTSLLTTKLYVPPASPRLVPRPRLIRQLDEGLRLGQRLTLVSAPAGFGKTTLLSDWLRQVERPVAWLSLDDSDNDPVRFTDLSPGRAAKYRPKHRSNRRDDAAISPASPTGISGNEPDQRHRRGSRSGSSSSSTTIT